MSDPRFRVIEGNAKPKPFRARKKGDPELLVCPKCNSTATVEVKLGRMLDQGKIKGGTKQLRCADCGNVLI